MQSCFRATQSWCVGLLLPRHRTLHLPSFNFMRFLPAHLGPCKLQPSLSVYVPFCKLASFSDLCLTHPI